MPSLLVLSSSSARGLLEHGEISLLALRPTPGQPRPTAALTRQVSTHQLAAFLAAPGSCKPGAGASWMLLLLAHNSLLDAAPQRGKADERREGSVRQRPSSTSPVPMGSTEPGVTSQLQ